MRIPDPEKGHVYALPGTAPLVPPEMDFLLSAVEKSQEKINGLVLLSIYKGNVTPIGRQSPIPLYNQELSSIDVEGGYNAIENYLVQRCGEAGLKIHTGRSRNDQVLTALRLCSKERPAACAAAREGVIIACCRQEARND